MIITSILAENVLKYASLEMRDLPESGIIAIGGPNESGKSTIGETLCFALLGRTFSCGPGELHKIIRWGQNSCSATLTFTAGDGGDEYRIHRSLDSDRNQSARLSRISQDEETIASGVDAVTEAMSRLLGYGFDEFIESFYLAQREISTPHRHSRAVKAMAGLTALEEAEQAFKCEIGEEQAAISGLEPQVSEIDIELEDMDLQEARLQMLEEEHEALNLEETEAGRQAEELRSGADSYRENHSRLRSTRQSLHSAAIVSGLLLFAAAVSAGIAWLPDSQGGSSWGVFAGFLGVLSLLFIVWFTLLKGRIRGLEQASEKFATQFKSMREAVAVVDDVDNEIPDAASDLSARITESTAEPDEVSAGVEPVLEAVHQEGQGRREELKRLEQAIYLEKERAEKAKKLKQARDALLEKLAGHRYRISQRELAAELLAGAGRHLSRRFNRDLRDLVSRPLPLFTEGRYAHLKIDDDLNVQVFSNEKRDFMELDEISSGTQRQIMLAVRLALSQQLVNSVVKGRQFIFLDEPFAFFDRERTRNSLEVLPELSDEITQVWIVAQEFPEDSRLDCRIECAREYGTLSQTATGQTSA